MHVDVGQRKRQRVRARKRAERGTERGRERDIKTKVGVHGWVSWGGRYRESEEESR